VQAGRNAQLASYRLPEKRSQSGANTSSDSQGSTERLRDGPSPGLPDMAYKNGTEVSGSGRTRREERAPSQMTYYEFMALDQA